MNLNKEFRTLVVPVIKGSPILIGILFIAIMVARRVVIYSNPEYQTDAAVKVDNRDYGVGNFFLFNEEGGPKQSLASAFLTEVELLKTRNLKEQTFKRLDFFASYFRVGKVTTREIFYDSPFKIDFEVFDKSVYGERIFLDYIGDEAFVIGKTEENDGDLVLFDKPFQNERFKITLSKNENFWKKEKLAIKEDDRFAFELHSLDDLVKSITASNLFIKPIDKEITIVKIYYKHEVPEKAALFCNAFVDAYIDEARLLKNNETTKTLEFINQEILNAEQNLKDSEDELTTYKQSQSLVNMNQETDAVLKELTALDLQLVNSKLEEVELNNLSEYLLRQSDISDFSPNFKALGDKVFEDGFLKLKALEVQHDDLLQKYTPTSSEIQVIQSKITVLRKFLIESIQKRLNNISEQKKELQKNIEGVNERLRAFPDKQRKVSALERDVALLSQTYTYLISKRTELMIAQSSNFVYHRVLDYAEIPKNPSAPNIPLIYALFIFVALLTSLVIIYIWYYFVNKIESKEELKDYVQAPIISTISDIADTHVNDVEPYLNLYTNIRILQKESAVNDVVPPWTILISSIMPNEGRTFVATGLGRAMAYFDKKTLLIDLDNRKPKLHQNFGLENKHGVADFLRKKINVEDVIIQTGVHNLDILTGGNLSEIPEELVFSPKIAQLLKDMKQYYDVIIVDVPPTAVHIESVAIMHEADLNLFMIQAHKSKVRFIKHIKTFLEEYKIPNFYLVLNGIHQASGFYAKSYRLGLRRRLIKILSGRIR